MGLILVAELHASGSRQYDLTDHPRSLVLHQSVQLGEISLKLPENRAIIRRDGILSLETLTTISNEP